MRERLSHSFVLSSFRSAFSLLYAARRFCFSSFSPSSSFLALPCPPLSSLNHLVSLFLIVFVFFWPAPLCVHKTKIGTQKYMDIYGHARMKRGRAPERTGRQECNPRPDLVVSPVGTSSWLVLCLSPWLVQSPIWSVFLKEMTSPPPSSPHFCFIAHFSFRCLFEMDNRNSDVVIALFSFSTAVLLLYLCLKKHLKFFPRVNKKSRHRFFFFFLHCVSEKRTRARRE